MEINLNYLGRSDSGLQAQLLKEYPVNKKLIKTSWGILDKDRLSGTMRIIDGSMLIQLLAQK